MIGIKTKKNISTALFVFCAVLLTGQILFKPTATSWASDIGEPKNRLSEKELDCLARNVYFEAKNQSIAGQTAVALVTLNRATDGRFPRTICGVVSQGSIADPNKKVGKACQFSWFCSGKSNMPNKQSDEWILARQVAVDAYRMHYKGLDITNGATHFHATYVKPGWAKTLHKVGRIDDHVFYKWDGRI